MPRIRNLRRYIKRKFKEGWKGVRFKVIGPESYRKKDWRWSKEVTVHCWGDSDYRVEVAPGLLEKRGEVKKFKSLEEALDYIEEEFPPEEYVYYVPRYKWDPKYFNVRDLLHCTLWEADAWRILLARALGHLNGREFIGARRLTNTSKACERCGGKAAVLLVFKYAGRAYGVYYCKNCLVELINNAAERLHKEVEKIKTVFTSRKQPLYVNVGRCG